MINLSKKGENMKNKDSFDIPAYKFGIIKLNNDVALKLLERANENIPMTFDFIKQICQFNELSLIPFDDVDGLTIKEVQEALKIRGSIIMSCYNHVNFLNPQKNHSQVNLLNSFILLKDEVEANQNTPIDQAMEKMLENGYSNYPEEVKKMCRCFFERYQDKTHQDTVDRINKINIRK